MKILLVVFGGTINMDSQLESAKYLRDNFDYKLRPIYIRDLAKKDMVGTGAETILFSKGHAVLFQEMMEIEEKEIELVKQTLKSADVLEELEVKVGIFEEEIAEEMKTSDTLLLTKDNVISDRVIAALRHNYKNLILLGKKPIKNLSNIAIANDDGIKINRSCYQFMNMFPTISSFKSITVVKKEEEEPNVLMSYMKAHSKEVEEKIVHGLSNGIAEFNNSDLLIMGNLSRSYFLRRITGKNGLTLITEVEVPIFIG